MTRLPGWSTLLLVLFAALPATAQVPGLENHYTFDDPANPELDASGKNRNLEIEEAEWLEDEERGGVLEFFGADDGFARAEIPELPGDSFTIAFWAYRDSELAGQGAGGNDGLFQVQLDGDTPANSPAQKVIGGWVQKSDAAVWGRLHTADVTQVNLDRSVFFMEDDTWTHFAYRGRGDEFQLVVNGDPDVGPISIYDGTLDLHDTLFIGKQGGIESWGGRIDDFRVYSRALTDEEIQQIMTEDGGNPILGDFNGDGVLDATDIDLLSAAVLAGQPDPSFDLDNDGQLTQEDRRVWVEDIKNTWFGDANLDGEFATQDLILVFQAGQFEDGVPGNSTWATGDWSGDTEFTTADFLLAFQAGGFEKGPRPAAAAVPEPTGGLLLLIVALVPLFRKRNAC